MNFFRPPLVRGGRFSSPSSGTPYAFPFPAPFLALNCFRSARSEVFRRRALFLLRPRVIFPPHAPPRRPDSGALSRRRRHGSQTPAATPPHGFFPVPSPPSAAGTERPPRVFYRLFSLFSASFIGPCCRKMPPTPTKNGNSGGKAAEAGFCGKFFALRFFPCYAIIRTRKKEKEKKS